MVHGIWSIAAPAAGDPVAPDVLLVPVVGFDRQNYRLGYGGGYYDRTLAAATRPRTIGSASSWRGSRRSTRSRTTFQWTKL